MPVPGLSLLGLKRIRGFVSILRYINPTIIIIINGHIYYTLTGKRGGGGGGGGCVCVCGINKVHQTVLSWSLVMYTPVCLSET